MAAPSSVPAATPVGAAAYTSGPLVGVARVGSERSVSVRRPWMVVCTVAGLLLLLLLFWPLLIGALAIWFLWRLLLGRLRVAPTSRRLGGSSLFRTPRGNENMPAIAFRLDMHDGSSIQCVMIGEQQGGDLRDGDTVDVSGRWSRRLGTFLVKELVVGKTGARLRGRVPIGMAGAGRVDPFIPAALLLIAMDVAAIAQLRSQAASVKAGLGALGAGLLEGVYGIALAFIPLLFLIGIIVFMFRGFRRT